MHARSPLRGDVGDLEQVAERVADHLPPVAVGGVERLLDRLGPGGHRPPVGGVGIVDIDVQEGWERVPLPAGSDGLAPTGAGVRDGTGAGGG